MCVSVWNNKKSALIVGRVTGFVKFCQVSRSFQCR